MTYLRIVRACQRQCDRARYRDPVAFQFWAEACREVALLGGLKYGRDYM